MDMDKSRGREYRRTQARKHKRANITAMKAIFPKLMPMSRTWDAGITHPLTRQGHSWMGEMRNKAKEGRVMPPDDIDMEGM